jgi:3-oxoadipate enol-lactonase
MRPSSDAVLDASLRLSTNGITMFVVDAGNGRPVVFLHGLGWDHSLWNRAMARFKDRYRVIAADTRGHGLSRKPAGPYSVQTFADDWHGLLVGLGLKRPCLVGLSQGGMIAQLLAVQHPDAIGALVLVSTACRSDPAVRDKLEERIRKMQSEGPEAAARLAAQSIFSPRFLSSKPAAVEAFVQWRAAMDQAPLMEAARAAYGFDLTDKLRAVSVPSMVVYGEDDALTPPSLVAQVAAALPGSKLVGVPEAGHMIPFEQPAAFEAILASFLDQHYPAQNKETLDETS